MVVVTLVVVVVLLLLVAPGLARMQHGRRGGGRLGGDSQAVLLDGFKNPLNLVERVSMHTEPTTTNTIIKKQTKQKTNKKHRPDGDDGALTVSHRNVPHDFYPVSQMDTVVCAATDPAGRSSIICDKGEKKNKQTKV